MFEVKTKQEHSCTNTYGKKNEIHRRKIVLTSVFAFSLNMELSNTSNIDAAVSLFHWSLQIFVRCWCPIVFILGIIGHSLSIYVFTRPTLRLNPCARYFLASAIAGYFIILINIPIRTLQWGYGIEYITYSIATCKIVTFLLVWMRYVG